MTESQAAKMTVQNDGGLSVEQEAIDDRLSAVIRHLARSGMDHDTFDNVYAPLLQLRDMLVPGRYS